MEKVEPVFVPEWLKSNGSAKAARQTTPSVADSGGRVASNSSNVSPKRTNNSNKGRSFVSDKTTSTYFRRSSSSNGYSNSRPNGSYGRNNRDNEWDTEKITSHHKDNGYSHPRREYAHSSGNRSDNNLLQKNRFDKDLRRSYTTPNGKRGDTWSEKGTADSINSYKSNNNKASFQKDFPSLGGEVREIKRISSPGLTNLINSLPSDKWSSALAEAPTSAEKDGVLGSNKQFPSNNSGPNVSDILTMSPSRSNSSSPQLPNENQKAEEQAVKQARQLVPMTSSMPKTLVHSASEKLKPKVGQQMQISSSLQSNHSYRGTLVRSDPIRSSSTGKIKPEQEVNSVEHKPTPVLERKPSAQSKSRNDFFNLMRKKSLEIPQSSLSPSDLGNDIDASSLVEKENEVKFKDKSGNVIEMAINECGKECSRFNAFSYSEEREVAFLHSLGWENSEEEEEEGLTKEEIDAFYKDLNEHIKARPSSRSLQKVQLKCLKLLDNHTGNVINGCFSSGLSLSDPKLES